MKPDDIRARALFLQATAYTEGKAAGKSDDEILAELNSPQHKAAAFVPDFDDLIQEADALLIELIAEYGISDAAELMRRVGSETLDDLDKDELAIFVRIMRAYSGDVDEAIDKIVGPMRAQIDVEEIWERFNAKGKRHAAA